MFTHDQRPQNACGCLFLALEDCRMISITSLTFSLFWKWVICRNAWALPFEHKLKSDLASLHSRFVNEGLPGHNTNRGNSQKPLSGGRAFKQLGVAFASPGCEEISRYLSCHMMKSLFERISNPTPKYLNYQNPAETIPNFLRSRLSDMHPEHFIISKALGYLNGTWLC